jgi:ribonuclease E
VREKVSFLTGAQPDAAAPDTQSPPEPEPASAAEAAPPPVPEPPAESQPRRAGWWSRRFGGE